MEGTMGFKKLIKNVQQVLSNDVERTRTSRERIEELLGELEKKEKKLNHKLSEENNPKKRRDIKLKLKIIAVQKDKGGNLLHEMDKESR